MSGMPMLGRALASLTRRRFLLGAGAVAGAGAAVAAGVAIDRAVDTGGPAAAGNPAPRRSLRCRSAPSRACPRGSTPGTPCSPATSTVTRSRRCTTGCCSSTSTGTRRRPAPASSRRRCAHSSAPTPGRPTGCCSPPGGASRISRTRCTPARRSRSRRRSRASSCPRSTTITCACTSPATTSRGWPRIEAALVRGAPLPGADGPLDCRACCGGARRGPGSSARACRRRTRMPAGFRQATRSGRRTAVHGVQVEPQAQPGHRGRRYDPRRCLRRRDDDARQLHAAAARHWYGQLSEARARRPHVRAPGHLRAGHRRFTTDAESDPSCSARRSAATA